MKLVHHPYSAFLRGPTTVLPELDVADVVLERRDEEDLVLTLAHRATARAEGMVIVSRVIADIVKNQPDILASLFEQELPWMHWLPDADKELAANELLAELVAGSATGMLDPFARAVREWEETALVWSDPELARRLRGPFSADGPEIPRPVSG